MEEKLLRPNVCIIVIDQDNNFLLAERTGETGHWQFPQGGMEIEEDQQFNDFEIIRLNALRELEEEVGITSKQVELISILQCTYEYEFSSPKSYEDIQYAGQKQRYAVFRLAESKDRLELLNDTSELSQLRWVTKEEILKLAEPKRLKGYLRALEEIASLLKL